MAGLHPGKRPKLKRPSYPSGDKEGIPYELLTGEEKCVADFAGLSLLQVMALDVFSFWALLRDAIIWNHSGTKKGREWLKNAHRLTITEPEEDKLNRKYGKGGS